ncbi:MAG: hypothetical protein K0R47_118 [Brevibacillus sp.]|nr:hypothetical protein [Brevibacillus sp.]
MDKNLWLLGIALVVVVLAAAGIRLSHSRLKK